MSWFQTLPSEALERNATWFLWFLKLCNKFRKNEIVKAAKNSTIQAVMLQTTYYIPVLLELAII